VLRPSVAVDAKGCALLSGYFRGHLHFTTTDLVSASWSYYLARLDPQGKVVGAQQLKGKSSSAITSGVDPAGNVVLGGAFVGEVRVGGETLGAEEMSGLVVATFDPSGALRKATHYPGDPASWFNVRCAPTEDGGALLAGTYQGSLDLGGRRLRSSPDEPGLFIAKLGADGASTWCRSVRAPVEAAGLTVHAASDGDVVLTASFRGTIDFGDALLSNDGRDPDLVVARLAGASTPAASERETR
jgi:hypothetical protein